MKRWAIRIGAVFAAIVSIVLGPIAFIEVGCRPQGDVIPYAALQKPDPQRTEIRTLLTYPEWHIVHAYHDYAKVLETGDPHDFGYLKAIGGFWGSLCKLSRASGPLGDIDAGTKQMVYVIGASFTVELLFKAAYEETLGRIATWVRGPQQSPLDELSATQARAYAGFLTQTPWYRWDFAQDRADLSTASHAGFRDWERRTALGLEYGVKAKYAQVIAGAVAGTGYDKLTLQMIVTNISASDLESFKAVKIIAQTDAGITVETPRYRELTHLLIALAEQGADFVELASNDDIMFTVTSPLNEPVESAIYSADRQGYGDTRHLVLVKVNELAATLRAMGAKQVEHIHDY